MRTLGVIGIFAVAGALVTACGFVLGQTYELDKLTRAKHAPRRRMEVWPAVTTVAARVRTDKGIEFVSAQGVKPGDEVVITDPHGEFIAFRLGKPGEGEEDVRRALRESGHAGRRTDTVVLPREGSGEPRNAGGGRDVSERGRLPGDSVAVR